MGRTLEQKQAPFKAIARLAQARSKLRPDDVVVVLTENTSSDWSFGGGVAQYVPTPALTRNVHIGVFSPVRALRSGLSLWA